MGVTRETVKRDKHTQGRALGMAGRPQKTGGEFLLELLELLQVSDEHAKQFERSARRSEELADAVQDLLSRAMYKLECAVNGSPSQDGASWRFDVGSEGEPDLKRFARPVGSLLIRLRPDGSSGVSIDGERPFKLSGRLTGLLVFAASGKPDADGIASFRPIAEAARALSASKHCVSNLVYRLRQELDRHNWNPCLLETLGSPRSNSTLRLRTRGVVVIDN